MIMDTYYTKNTSFSATSGPKEAECWGRAKEVLEAYRRRCLELKNEGRAKPDMVAYRQLGTPPRRHGELPGVPKGLAINGRGEAVILGIHQEYGRGIDALTGKPCYAVCISGKYADDDASARDGTIYYTGEGGRDNKGVHVEDQDETRKGNEALILSLQTGTPIRVIRGKRSLYHYLGLYRCVDYTYEEGKHGKKVFRFELIPVTENHCPAEGALPLKSTYHPKEEAFDIKAEAFETQFHSRVKAEDIDTKEAQLKTLLNARIKAEPGTEATRAAPLETKHFPKIKAEPGAEALKTETSHAMKIKAEAGTAEGVGTDTSVHGLRIKAEPGTEEAWTVHDRMDTTDHSPIMPDAATSWGIADLLDSTGNYPASATKNSSDLPTDTLTISMSEAIPKKRCASGSAELTARIPRKTQRRASAPGELTRNMKPRRRASAPGELTANMKPLPAKARPTLQITSMKQAPRPNTHNWKRRASGARARLEAKMKRMERKRR